MSLIGNIKSSELYTQMGAHPTDRGTRFCVYAPGAKNVELIRTHEGNECQRTQMWRHWDGRWETEIEKARAGTTYQYIVTAQNGRQCKKLDPFSFKIYSYGDRGFHSVVVNTQFAWDDFQWRKEREKYAHPDTPVSIYEIHLPSWQKEASTYRDLAYKLASYCKEMGFTHVEIFSFLEQSTSGPFAGYQPLGYFAPNHRLFSQMGWCSLHDAQEFIQILHKEGIGVILDWVPGHFNKEESGLSEFDGTPLFEYPDRRENHGAWQLNFSSEYVRNFLLSSVIFWLRKMKIDGIRIDALDEISRAGNGYDVRSFCRQLSKLVREEFPGVLLIAECWQNEWDVTSDLGFHRKWTGESKDILGFFKRPFGHRDVNTPISAAFAGAREKRVWHTTHDMSGRDEHCCNRGSLYDQIPYNDHFRKLDNLRLMLSYFMVMPGHKMIFMGDEFGQKEQWVSRVERNWSGVEWELLGSPEHKGMQQMVKALNHLYKTYPDLHRDSFGIEWIDTKDTTNHIISFRRGRLVCIFNFGPGSFDSYDVHFPDDRAYVREMVELFNSDAGTYRPPGNVTYAYLLRNAHGGVTGFSCKMAPFSSIIFEEK